MLQSNSSDIEAPAVNRWLQRAAGDSVRVAN
jgi:hypothetical protein